MDSTHVRMQVRIGRLERSLAAERNSRRRMVAAAALVSALGGAVVARWLPADGEHRPAVVSASAALSPSPAPSPAASPDAQRGALAPSPRVLGGYSDALAELAMNALDGGNIRFADELLARAEAELTQHATRGGAAVIAVRGRYLFEIGRHREAVSALTRAASADPTLAMAYLYRGWTASELGDQRLACHDFESFLAIAPPAHPDRPQVEDDRRRLECR